MKTITTTYNPETHKLVPVEPTPEMLCTLMQWDPETGFSILPEYRAMLAAVPEAPEQADNWQQYAKPGETAQQCIERHRAEQDALMTLLAQARAEQAAKAEGQEQRSEDEPVAWGFHNTALTGRNRWMMLREQVPENDQYGGAMWTPLYTTPQRREWVGLTKEEVGTLTVFPGLFDIETPLLAEYIRGIEAKLREKNK